MTCTDLTLADDMMATTPVIFNPDSPAKTHDDDDDKMSDGSDLA